LDIPSWFSKAIATPFEDKYITVANCKIHYLLWEDDASNGEQQKPGIVLVHGNGAHAHWWTFIAPFLMDNYRVAAIDLSGMGDSGHRSVYSPEVLAEEIMAVVEDANFGLDTVVVGHSFGGYITLKFGLVYPERVAGVVLVDSAVRPPDFKWERDPRRSPVRPKRVYEDFESALARFRLMPPQDCENDYILDYIGRHSLEEAEGGWTWKFDDNLFGKFQFSDMSGQLAYIKCRVGVIYGENSYLFTQEIADFMFKVLDESVPFVEIPQAQHHLFLDQPLAFVSSIRTLLAEWRHSRPHRNSIPELD